MIVYVDTSAAMKLVVEETESAAMTSYLQRCVDDQTLVASLLLHTEMHRAAARHPTQVDRGSVATVLSVVNLVDLERTDLLMAAALGSHLRSNDAVHLATALRLDVDTFVAYDKELLGVAAEAGLAVLSPN